VVHVKLLPFRTVRKIECAYLCKVLTATGTKWAPSTYWLKMKE